MKYGGILILASAIGALASPTQHVLSSSKPRPLVIWHGLGASARFPAFAARTPLMNQPSQRRHIRFVRPRQIPIRNREDASGDIHTLGIHRSGPKGGQTGYFRAFSAELPATASLVSDFFVVVLLTHESTGQFGNVDEQVELVAQQLKDIRKLSGGFDAIGFSQGSYIVIKVEY